MVWTRELVIRADEMWADSGYILIVEPMGFASSLIMRNKRKKKKLEE